MLDPLSRRRHATAGAILAQRFEHDFADGPAGLLRQRARQIGGFGIADVHLIFHRGGPGDLVHMYFRVGPLRNEHRSRHHPGALPKASERQPNQRLDRFHSDPLTKSSFLPYRR